METITLPELTGTEKQIKWADSIRSFFVEGYEKELSKVAKKGKLLRSRGIKSALFFAPFGYTDISDEDIVKIHANMQKTIETADNAGWWIENREKLTTAILAEDADFVKSVLEK